jgi:hypothetical protein
VSGAIAALIRFHETGGHEGDGSDETLTKAKVELAAFSPTVSEADELVERTDSGLVADMLTSAAHQPHTRAFTNAQIIEAFVALQAAALRAQPSNEAEGWRDIASAPKDGTEFLAICCPGDETYWLLKADLAGSPYYDDGTGPVHVPCATHWRPLPAAPGEASVQAGGEVERLARAFIAKLDECQPYIDTAFVQMANHGMPYTGPQYGEELDALRAALNPEGSDHEVR